MGYNDLMREINDASEDSLRAIERLLAVPMTVRDMANFNVNPVQIVKAEMVLRRMADQSLMEERSRL